MNANSPPCDELGEKKLSSFNMLALGLAVSILGTSLTNFGIGIWAYEQAASISDFTLILVAGLVPAMLLSPIAGTYSDRWDRKKVLLAGQAGALLCTLSIVSMYLNDSLTPAKIIGMVALSSAFGAFITPAFIASVPMLVADKDLGRANGTLSVLVTSAQGVAPAIAGFVIDSHGINTVFVIDFLTFLVGITVLLKTSIPMPTRRDSVPGTGLLHAVRDLKSTVAYVRAKEGLMSMLSIGALLQLNIGAIFVLLLPMVLSFATKTQYGLIQSFSAVGLVLGGLIMMVWGGPQRRVTAIFFFALLAVLTIVIMPTFQSIPALIACTIVIGFGGSIAGANTSVIWQKKVAPNRQASVAGIRMSLSKVAMTVGMLSSGYLADTVFEPNMAEDGIWAESLGVYFGVGQGRGAALMMSIFGGLSFLLLAIAWATPRVRHVESQLPDY